MPDSRTVGEAREKIWGGIKGGIKGGVKGQPLSTINPYLFSLSMFGSEDDEGESGGEGGNGEEEEATPPPKAEEETPPADDDDDKTFDAAYVKKLRDEAAANRIRAKKAEDELAERKKAEMSELERAQAERDEAIAKAEEVEKTLRQTRLESAVTSSAQSANFHDPGDALSLIDESEISVNDEGIPNTQSVNAAIERLAKAKPHLVRSGSAGSGDGGARGAGGGTLDEEKEKDLNEEFKQRGGVPFPRA